MRLSRHTRDLGRRTVEQLRDVGATISGIVVNGVEERDAYGYGNYGTLTIVTTTRTTTTSTVSTEAKMVASTMRMIIQTPRRRLRNHLQNFLADLRI